MLILQKEDKTETLLEGLNVRFMEGKDHIEMERRHIFSLKSSVALISITLSLQILSSNHYQHLSGSVRLRQGLQVLNRTSFSETSYQESSFFTVSSPPPPLSFSTSFPVLSLAWYSWHVCAQ